MQNEYTDVLLSKSRTNLVKDFLHEKGVYPDVPISTALDYLSIAILKDEDVGVSMIRELKEKKFDAGLLAAYNLIGEEVESDELKREVLNIFSEGIKDAEAGEQLGLRLALLHSLTGRVAAGYSWASAEDVRKISQIALDRNPEDVPTEYLDYRIKIESDLGQKNFDKARRV